MITYEINLYIYIARDNDYHHVKRTKEKPFNAQSFLLSIMKVFKKMDWFPCKFQNLEDKTNKSYAHFDVGFEHQVNIIVRTDDRIVFNIKNDIGQFILNE